MPLLHLVQSFDGYVTGRGVTFCAELLDLTEAFLVLARADDLRCVVFAGDGGRAFIGGAAVNHLQTMRHPEDGRSFLPLIHKLCPSIRSMPVPVLCQAADSTVAGGRVGRAMLTSTGIGLRAASAETAASSPRPVSTAG